MNQNSNSQQVSDTPHNYPYDTYHYPKWVQSSKPIKQINDNNEKPIWVSLLRTKDRTLLDVRRFRDGHSTNIGIILTHNAGLNLIDILDKFLAGELENLDLD